MGHLSSLSLETDNNFIDKFDSYGYLNPIAEREKWLPDEANTASSIATGYSVPKNRVSQDSSGNDLYTFFDLAHQYSKKTGLITTSSLSYITPACFTVHSKYWEDEKSYARKQLNSDGLHLLLGGGKKYFQDDDYKLEDKFAQNGYTMINNLSTLDSLSGNSSSDNTKVVGLFADEELAPPSDRKVNLDQLTQKSLSFLSNKNGFFLLINDIHIDWFTHQENNQDLLDELQELNNTINVVLEYQKNNPNTLALLVGSYDCGGVAPIQSLQAQNRYNLKQVSNNHTGNYTPIFTAGKFHSKFDRVMKPKQLGQTLKDLAIQ